MILRRASIVIVTLLVCAGSLAAPPAKPPPPRSGRDVIVIDGEWRTKPTAPGRNVPTDWSRSIPDGTDAATIPSLQPNVADAWYWRRFDVPIAWKGQTLRLRFGAVADRAEAWLNGQSLGYHDDPFTPFEFNITKSFTLGTQNLVAVHVTGRPDRGIGVWQGVTVVSHDEAFLYDVYPIADELGHVTANVSIQNLSKNAGDATLDAVIVAADQLKKPLSQTSLTVHVTPGSNVAPILISVKRRSMQLWSLETPALYRFQLAFHQNLDVLDKTETTFGFRQVGITSGQITLNGVTITPVSVDLSTDRPSVVSSVADVDRAKDRLRKLKASGVNVVYLSAPPPVLLDATDQIGLLVIEQHSPGRALELRELVQRDRSHPSIIGWRLREHAAPDEVRALQGLDPTRFVATPAGLALPGASDLVAPPAGLTPVAGG